MELKRHVSLRMLRLTHCKMNKNKHSETIGDLIVEKFKKKNYSD